MNNPKGLITDDDWVKLHESGVTYLMYQEEVAPTTGTYHFQGYLECDSPRGWSWFSDILEGCHWTKARGTAQENLEYCTKDESRVGDIQYIWGTISPGQGRRNDIVDLRDAIKSGKRGREIYDDDALLGAAVRYSRGMDKLLEAYSSAECRDGLRVIFHYGRAGTGKTHCAHVDGAYYLDGANGYWNGYNGEKILVLDEFSGSTLPPLMLQRLCDKKPFRANVKGSFVACNATTIHICSNYLPSQWWSEKTKYDEEAIYRRIDEVHHHNEFMKYRLFTGEVHPTKPETWPMTKLVDSLRGFGVHDFVQVDNTV